MVADPWRSEERLWLEGAGAYEELLHPECVMVFMEPVGIMTGQAIPESLAGAPRWDGVEMEARTRVDGGPDVVVLAYRAKATRRGETYQALCSSTYVRSDGNWVILQHQQTPL
ncbi:MAG: nuclear transport factor 2 family protein [Rhizobiaceae bacterium]|nr:nuclear transport factor 2 family protein [Rhizobiaceae bacterium]MCV0408842.1 nuclear transport factor 2 family protein [Rhizobiaceae bacterium]